MHFRHAPDWRDWFLSPGPFHWLQRESCTLFAINQNEHCSRPREGPHRSRTFSSESLSLFAIAVIPPAQSHHLISLHAVVQPGFLDSGWLPWTDKYYLRLATLFLLRFAHCEGKFFLFPKIENIYEFPFLRWVKRVPFQKVRNGIVLSRRGVLSRWGSRINSKVHSANFMIKINYRLLGTRPGTSFTLICLVQWESIWSKSSTKEAR